MSNGISWRLHREEEERSNKNALFTIPGVARRIQAPTRLHKLRLNAYGTSIRTPQMTRCVVLYGMGSLPQSCFDFIGSLWRLLHHFPLHVVKIMDGNWTLCYVTQCVDPSVVYCSPYYTKSREDSGEYHTMHSSNLLCHCASNRSTPLV
jgi:hypothetical protein